MFPEVETPFGFLSMRIDYRACVNYAVQSSQKISHFPTAAHEPPNQDLPALKSDLDEDEFQIVESGRPTDNVKILLSDRQAMNRESLTIRNEKNQIPLTEREREEIMQFIQFIDEKPELKCVQSNAVNLGSSYVSRQGQTFDLDLQQESLTNTKQYTVKTTNSLSNEELNRIPTRHVSSPSPASKPPHWGANKFSALSHNTLEFRQNRIDQIEKFKNIQTVIKDLSGSFINITAFHKETRLSRAVAAGYLKTISTFSSEENKNVSKFVAIDDHYYPLESGKSHINHTPGGEVADFNSFDGYRANSYYSPLDNQPQNSYIQQTPPLRSVGKYSKSTKTVENLRQSSSNTPLFSLNSIRYENTSTSHHRMPSGDIGDRIHRVESNHSISHMADDDEANRSSDEMMVFGMSGPNE